jgi:hypothetical protein
MIGIRGGAAKVARKATKKEIQLSWKERWCGASKDQIFSTLLLRAVRAERVSWAMCLSQEVPPR